MSIEATKWAWKQNLRGDLKVLLLALADSADKSGIAWPSRKTLMERTHFPKRTLQHFVRLLESQGFIKVIPRFRDNGSQTSNEYHLKMEGVHNACTPPVHNVCTPPVQIDGTPYNELSDELPEGTNCGKPQEDEVKIDDIMAQHEKLTKEEIFSNALRKSGLLTADGCAYIWRHCRAAGDANGFQAELTIAQKKQLLNASQRVGEAFPEIVWAVMQEWVGYTKHAEKISTAFNSPLLPSVSYFTKFVEEAADFASQYNPVADGPDDDWGVKLSAKD